MIASLAVFSLLSTAAYAQSSTSTANAYIPTSASSTCKTFLTALNSDKTLDTCATALVSASAAFAPGNYTGTPTSSSISKVLGTLCDSSCDSTTVRSKLTDFYSACSNEMTGEVLMSYDVLYSLIPFKDALCSKNDAGNYCVLESASSTSSAAASSSTVSVATVEKYLTESDGGVTSLNGTTAQVSNLLYLFLNPSSCTACTTNIMSAYMDFEAAIPYAPGFSQSVLMGGQSALIKNIKSSCGDAFLSSAVQAAGGISSTSDSSDAPRVVSSIQSLFSALGGLVVASLFI